VPTKDQIRYIGIKGYPTQNVMLVCNLDMLITFVVVGWPGTAHDTHILTSVLEEMKNVFPDVAYLRISKVSIYISSPHRLV